MEICKSLVTFCSKLNPALPASCDREFWEFTFVGMAFIASYNFSSKGIIKKNALFLLFPMEMSKAAWARVLQEGIQEQEPSTAPELGDFSHTKFCIFRCKTSPGEGSSKPNLWQEIPDLCGLAGGDSTKTTHWGDQGLTTKLISTDGCKKKI